MRLLFLACLLLAGCATNQQLSLYDQIGGKASIDRIAGRFIFHIGQSEDIRPYFANTNLDRFYEMFAGHICVLTDGPCSYDGDTMEQVHKGMDVNEADFNELVDLFIAAMDDEEIPHRVQNRLLQRLVPLREEIIYR